MIHENKKACYRFSAAGFLMVIGEDNVSLSYPSFTLAFPILPGSTNRYL